MIKTKIASVVLALFALCDISHAATEEDAKTYQLQFNEMIPASFQTQLSDAQIIQQKQDLLAQPELTALDHPEFVVVVDKNPSAQHASVYIVDQLNAYLIGSARVSTGQAGRKEYFFTPVGLFENKVENGNYRAEGTKNENGIRGLGAKGMRVFDFGWQTSNAGWGNHFEAKIRLQMHATDPDHLEQRLGHPASKGCVRVHHGLNAFLDKNGALDRNYDAKGSWVLSKDKKESKYDGRYMLVVDHPVAMP